MCIKSPRNKTEMCEPFIGKCALPCFKKYNPFSTAQNEISECFHIVHLSWRGLSQLKKRDVTINLLFFR